MKNNSSQGIIVGASQNQEWLLPWWWMNFRLHNSYPVTFYDLGDMSVKAQRWCQKRGDLVRVDINEGFVAKQEKIDQETANLWNIMHPDVWNMRSQWFKKPIIMEKTPYQNTVWLDLDCQVRGDLKPLFEASENEAGIAVAEEPEWSQNINLDRNLLLPGEIMYNSGVVAFRQGSKVVEAWAQEAIQNNHLHFGDQQILSKILKSIKLKHTTLPANFNCLVEAEPDHHAIILHWYGQFKEVLQQLISSLNQHFFINLSLD